jgi:hypothetical protein
LSYSKNGKDEQTNFNIILVDCSYDQLYRQHEYKLLAAVQTSIVIPRIAEELIPRIMIIKKIYEKIYNQ